MFDCFLATVVGWVLKWHITNQYPPTVFVVDVIVVVVVVEAGVCCCCWCCYCCCCCLWWCVFAVWHKLNASKKRKREAKKRAAANNLRPPPHHSKTQRKRRGSHTTINFSLPVKQQRQQPTDKPSLQQAIKHINQQTEHNNCLHQQYNNKRSTDNLCCLMQWIAGTLRTQTTDKSCVCSIGGDKQNSKQKDNSLLLTKES